VLLEGGVGLGPFDAALYVLRSLLATGAQVVLAESGSSTVGMWDHDDDPPRIEPDVFAVAGALALPADAPPQVRALVRVANDLLAVDDYVHFVGPRARVAGGLAGRFLRPVACPAYAERLSALLHGRPPGPKELDELTQWAAELGHDEAVAALIELGAAPQSRVDALAKAARQGKLAVVERLLGAGADPRAPRSDELTPMHAAADAHDDGACLRRLLAAARGLPGPGHATSPLHHAAAAHSLGATTALLEAGADPAARDATGSTPLHWAARAGALDVARPLLASGAPLEAADDSGRRALHLAVSDYGSSAAKMIALLLAAGAERDAQDSGGRTPVHLAIDKPGPEAIRVLVEAGARGNTPDQLGRTPIMACVRWSGPVSDIERLLAQGGDINAADQNGDTALHYAVRHNNHFVLADLFRLGARADLRNRDGKTAIDLACESGAPRTHVRAELERLGLMRK